MNEKLLGLVVSSTVYWLLTTSLAIAQNLRLGAKVQPNILPYLIENALELSALGAHSSRFAGARLDSSISNEHLTITYFTSSSQ